MISEVQKDALVKFGQHLQVLRKSKNLSLRKLALNCNIEHSDIKRYENGEINLTFLTIIELSRGLDIPVKELMDY
ncbi:helix-turn-helix domain-containing protein [Mucilaginibacter sp. McL0603]|uniref:helix-turn-helix domain-containing protein n=1 Tax=Mucilaginibacter sp. McL0603 TaxID=3415670 RepID=UPI003CF072AB